MKWKDLSPATKKDLRQFAWAIGVIVIVGVAGYAGWTLGNSAGYEEGHEDRSSTVAAALETVEADVATAVAGAYEQGYGDARGTIVPGFEAFATSVAVANRDLATAAVREADRAYQEGYQAGSARQRAVRPPTPAPRPSPAAASPLISDDVLALFPEGLVDRVVDYFTKHPDQLLGCSQLGEPFSIFLCLFAAYNS